MRLVAVDDVGRGHRPDQPAVDGVEPLTTDVPRRAEDADPEAVRGGVPPRPLAEADQRGPGGPGHVPGEFERVPLGPTEDAVHAEQGGGDVKDAGRFHRPPFTTTSSK